MPSQRFFELEQLCCGGKRRSWYFERFGTHTAGQGASHRCDSSKQLSFLNRFSHGSMVSFSTSQCWWHR